MLGDEAFSLLLPHGMRRDGERVLGQGNADLPSQDEHSFQAHSSLISEGSTECPVRGMKRSALESGAC